MARKQLQRLGGERWIACRLPVGGSALLAVSVYCFTGEGMGPNRMALMMEVGAELKIMSWGGLAYGTNTAATDGFGFTGW